MSRKLLSVAISFILLTSPVYVYAVENLILNGDFEEGEGGWLLFAKNLAVDQEILPDSKRRPRSRHACSISSSVVSAPSCAATMGATAWSDQSATKKKQTRAEEHLHVCLQRVISTSLPYSAAICGTARSKTRWADRSIVAGSQSHW